MNKLELVCRLRRECGVTGADPTSLTNQPEEINRLTDWINAAWVDIQSQREDWLWMRAPFSFATTNGQVSYTATDCGITDFGNWADDAFRNHVTASGTNSEIFMDYWSYENWRDVYYFGANRQVYARPMVICITPDKQLAMGPIAASGYTVTGGYFKLPAELDTDSATPSLPAQFHMAIVYRAMMFYGAFEAAQEVYSGGQTEFKNMMGKINMQQRHPLGFGGPLA